MQEHESIVVYGMAICPQQMAKERATKNTNLLVVTLERKIMRGES